MCQLLLSLIVGLGKLRKVKIKEKYKIVKILAWCIGEAGGSLHLVSPDLTKDETPDHAVDYKGHSISLLLVN